jgi:hypothetical protein
MIADPAMVRSAGDTRVKTEFIESVANEEHHPRYPEATRRPILSAEIA